MTGALERIAEVASGGAVRATELPWWEMRHEHTTAIRAALADRYAPATANKMLSALRGVLKACWRLELMSGEDYQRAADIPAVHGATIPAGRHVEAGEIAALVRVCREDASSTGARDAALLAVLFAAGLRRAEVVALRVSDYDASSGALTVRHGKGRHQRIAYLANGSARALDAWLELRGDEDPDGPLLCPVRKGGRIERRPMTSQAVLYRLRRRAEQAGVADFSPHDARRTYIGELLDAGADLAVVQRLAGHASVTTTARYDRRPEEAKRQASGLLHFPFN